MKHIKCLLCVTAASLVSVPKTDLPQKKGRHSQLENEASWDTWTTSTEITDYVDSIHLQICANYVQICKLMPGRVPGDGGYLSKLLESSLV